ncbi:uncharacterized protein LOC110462314 [Mizuhopecten yessoensis]|uniref:Uncharacterized protein n=1 Tax=Mizuhopecten yessoensis TaxID=6573 RepID=A0A210PYA3_MIZYE|nr:uncharacterized protein LOC110462314 [Mizuhopecten yessoensis]OWF41467.1 hypothetical protein KP79_PYT17358 [Mizuhopecten yessoensis]
MEQTDSEILLTENQELVSGTDDMGRMVYLVVDKTLDKSGQQGTADLIYNIVDEQGLYDQMGTSATLDTDSQLITGHSASVSLDARGTVYQYTVPVSSVENYQLPLGQGASNSITDKVRVERVEQLSANNLTQAISADMLNNSTTADIILASSEEPDLNDTSIIQVQAYPSQDYGSMMSMPFIPSNVPSNIHTLCIPTSMEDAQLLNNFSADAMESLQSLLDVDVDTTITTTTEELIDSALDPATPTISHENYDNSLRADIDQINGKLTQQRSRSTTFSGNHGDVRRSKRLSSHTPKKYNHVQHEVEEEIEERKIANRTPPELLNAEYMSQEDVNMVKKSVSNFRPNFSSYPTLCKCKHKEKGTDIPVEQIWLHKNQMYYLPQINILVISFEEYVGFLRQDKWYVSVGEITQRLIPNFRSEVESYLVKNICDKQFLSLEEIEYLKQRRCVNQSMKSGTMISLDTLRVMCKFLASTKAFIQAPTNGLSNAAHGIFYKKLLEKNTRCSKCGGAVKNIEASDRYVLLDSPVEILYSRRIQESSTSQETSLQKSMYVGEVTIGNVFFKSFKLDELTYISLKEIVECQVFNLQVLQSRLVQLQYRPRPAPTAIDCHFSNERTNVNQTLWIDLMTLRCACCMSRQRSPTSKIEVLQQMFSRGQYTCTFDLEIVAFDDYDSANNETVYTLDPHTYKITTRHNYNQSVHAGAGRKVQRSLSNEEEKRTETTNVVMKSNLPSVKPKAKSSKVTIRRTSPRKTVLEPSRTEEEEALSLKPGVYYFADKNSIVDFLKNKTTNDTLREDMECKVISQKRSNIPALSKPVFRVKSAPETAPHLIRSGSYSHKRANNQKTHAAPKRGFKRKLQELQTDTHFNTEVIHDFTQDVTYCENRTRKENDVSSSVQYYQDIQTVPQLSSQHGHDTYEYSTSGRHDLGLVESPEVQDKNVDSTAAHNVEEEMEFSHSCGGKGRLTTHPSSTVGNLQDVETQGTGHKSKVFLNESNNEEENYDDYSNNDFGEIEEEFSNSSADVKADNLHSVPENSKFSSPEQSNSIFDKNQDLSTSTPHSVFKGILRTPRKRTEYHSSESSSVQSPVANVDLIEQTRKLPCPNWLSPSARLRSARSGDLSLSQVKPNKYDIGMTPDEIVRTDLFSPGDGGIFSTPCVSPILDRKSDKTGKTYKMERLYNKCASLDTSTDADKSLHVLATVATDLETLDKTSQSNISDRNHLRVFNSVVPCELDKEKSVGVGTKKTMKRDRFVLFLRQLLDHVTISRESPSKKCVAVKFKDVAKTHFPALWKESGQTRLKKLARLLALSVPASAVEDGLPLT